MKIKIRKYRGCSENEICLTVVTTGNSSRSYFYSNLVRIFYKEDPSFDRLSIDIVCTYEDQPFRLHLFDSEFDDGTGRGLSGFLGYTPAAKMGLVIIDLEELKDPQEITESISLLRSRAQIPLMVLGFFSSDSRLFPFERLNDIAGELECFYKEIYRNDEEGYGSVLEFILNYSKEFDSSIKIQFDYLKYQSMFNDYFS